MAHGESSHFEDVKREEYDMPVFVYSFAISDWVTRRPETFGTVSILRAVVTNLACPEY